MIYEGQEKGSSSSCCTGGAIRDSRSLRQHNLQFKEGDPQDGLLFFAEAALVCLALERFVRAILGADAGEKYTLENLLQKGVSKGLIRLPWDDQEEAIKKVSAVRNTLLHGNYEQAVRDAGCASPAEYFQKQFAGEVESALATPKPSTRMHPTRTACSLWRAPREPSPANSSASCAVTTSGPVGHRSS